MKNKNRKPNRLKEYDYSQSGYYFVTICIKNHNKYLGKVTNNKLKLNNYGKIVERVLLSLNEKYERMELDYYVIMPNHVHAIIILNEPTNVGEG